MNDLENWPSNINVVLPSTDDAKTQKLIELHLILIIHMQKCIVREMKDIDETWNCNRPHCESTKKLWKHMLFCRDRVSCVTPYCVFSKQILAHWKYCEKDDCPVRLSPEEDLNTGDAMIEKLREVVTPTMLRVQCDSEIAQFTGESIIGNGKERYLLITSDIRKQYVQELIKEIFSTNYFCTLADEHVCDLVDFATKAEIKMFEKAKSRDEYYRLTAEMKHRIPKEIEKQLEQQMTEQQAAQQRPSEVTIDSQRSASTTDSPSAEATTAANSKSPVDVKQLFAVIDSGVSGDSQPPEDQQSSQIAMQSLPEIEDWHRSVTPDLRAHIIQKLTKSIYPKAIERGIALDSRLKNLIPWATKLEDHYFQMANSTNEYYHMIASKIYTVEHCREEIRAKKSAQSLQQSAEQQVSEPQQSTIVHPADTNPSHTGGAPVAAVIQSADEV